MPTVSLTFDISAEQFAFVNKLRKDEPPEAIFRMAIELGLLDLADDANRVHRENIGSVLIANGVYGKVIESQGITKATKATPSAAESGTPTATNSRSRFAALPNGNGATHGQPKDHS